MSHQWFRSWHGAPTDPKWLGIARKAGVAPGIVAAIVWALLDRASQASDRGSIAGYDADGLACFMGCEAEQVEVIVAVMHEKGMLTENVFTGWEKHQPKREDGSAERAKEWRERKRTQANATEPEKTLDTDTDTDTDKEREKARAQENDPVHWKVAQEIIAERSGDVDDWELDFLHSVKWKPSLTKPQQDTLKAIQSKLEARSGKPQVLPSVKRGTPAYDAWIAYYRQRSGGRPTFHERQDALTVPTEWPPAEKAA